MLRLVLDDIATVENKEPIPNLQGYFGFRTNYNLPENFDYRTNWKECTREVRDQGSACSSIAFSGIVNLEQRFCIASGGEINVHLSLRDLISCCNSTGSIESIQSYLVKTGVVLESCFPFSIQSFCIDHCIDGNEWKKYKAKSYKLFSGVNAIKTELVANGPLQTGFTVYNDFMSYKSGIYVHTSGSQLGGHAVIIIGYGVENGINYWICQNSWGTSWGENGYFRIKMGECGIDSAAYAGEPEI